MHSASRRPRSLIVHLVSNMHAALQALACLVLASGVTAARAAGTRQVLPIAVLREPQSPSVGFTDRMVSLLAAQNITLVPLSAAQHRQLRGRLSLAALLPVRPPPALESAFAKSPNSFSQFSN